MALLTRRTLVGGVATLVGGLSARKHARAEEVVMHPLSEIVRVNPPGPLPDIGCTSLDGAPKHLVSDWRGRVIVLNFWATWCIPCVAELPALDRLAQSEPGFAVLAVSADRAGAEVVKPFLAAHGIAHATILLDPHMAVGMAFGAVGFPTTLIIDAAGRLRGRLEGPANWAGAADSIRALVA